MRDVVYEDVCIKDTKNPILMDSKYSYMGEASDKLTSFEGIILLNVRVLSAGMRPRGSLGKLSAMPARGNSYPFRIHIKGAVL